MLFHDFADLDESTQYWFLLQVWFIPRVFELKMLTIERDLIWFDLLCLTPLSVIFQLYHGDQF